MRFSIHLLITLWVLSCSRVQADDLIGSDVKLGGSRSTCTFLNKKSGLYECGGVLVEKNQIQTASHCPRYLPWRDLEVFCDQKTDGTFGFQSSLTGTIWMKSAIISGIKVPDCTISTSQLFPIPTEVDQAILELTNSAPTEIVAQRFTAEEYTNLITSSLPNPTSGRMNEKYTCIAESMGPDENHKTGTLRSGALTTYDYWLNETGKIESNYLYPLTSDADLEFMKTRRMNEGKDLIAMMQRFQPKVLSVPGDSGSPLYCYENSKGPQSQKILGILARANNSYSPSGVPGGTSSWLKLGSEWGLALDPATHFTRYKLE